MKRIIGFIVILSLLCSLFLLFRNDYSPESIHAGVQEDMEYTIPKSPERNVYNIYAEYDGKNKIKAEMNLTYVNKTGTSIDKLYFHLYPNMFSSSKRFPF